MRFMVDESTGQAVAEFLRGEGHDVLVVVESLPQANDDDILQRAVTEGRIVVTNDKDFGDLVFRSGLSHTGVVLLRLKNDGAANRVAAVRAVLERHADALSNHFIVATETHIRIREASPKTDES